MKLILTFAASALSFSAAYGAVPTVEANWPAWRGPLGNGISPTANPPIHWSETKGVKWKVQVPGRGTATPIIWSDQVFLLTAISTDMAPSQVPPQSPGGEGGLRLAELPTQTQKFTLLSIDRTTGKTL